MYERLVLPACLLALAAPACGGDGSSTSSPYGTSTVGPTTSETSGPGDGEPGDGEPGDGEPGDGDGDTLFDVASGDGDPGDGGCMLPHTPCDQGTTDPFAAMGLGCPGETAISPAVDAHPDGMAVRASFGQTATYDPREGASYFVLSTGHTAELVFLDNFRWLCEGDGGPIIVPVG